jgi:hypothetical protein
MSKSDLIQDNLFANRLVNINPSKYFINYRNISLNIIKKLKNDKEYFNVNSYFKDIKDLKIFLDIMKYVSYFRILQIKKTIYSIEFNNINDKYKKRIDITNKKIQNEDNEKIKILLTMRLTEFNKKLFENQDKLIEFLNSYQKELNIIINYFNYEYKEFVKQKREVNFIDTNSSINEKISKLYIEKLDDDFEKLRKFLNLNENINFNIPEFENNQVISMLKNQEKIIEKIIVDVVYKDELEDIINFLNQITEYNIQNFNLLSQKHYLQNLKNIQNEISLRLKNIDDNKYLFPIKQEKTIDKSKLIVSKSEINNIVNENINIVNENIEDQKDDEVYDFLNKNYKPIGYNVNDQYPYIEYLSDFYPFLKTKIDIDEKDIIQQKKILEEKIIEKINYYDELKKIYEKINMIEKRTPDVPQQDSRKIRKIDYQPIEAPKRIIVRKKIDQPIVPNVEPIFRKK